jgi:hypothetical protein
MEAGESIPGRYWMIEYGSEKYVNGKVQVTINMRGYSDFKGTLVSFDLNIWFK